MSGTKARVRKTRKVLGEVIDTPWGYRVKPSIYRELSWFKGGYQNGYYQTLNAYLSGTRFRYLLGNNEPAYVYAFAADETGAAPTQIFPMKGVSPLLDYAENVIAFPGEFNWIQLDDRAGTDYLVVLYSKKALNIATIRNQFARERGAFPERVARAVGSDYIPPSQARYESNRLALTATSSNLNAVFGLLLAIKHQ
jgi:hypothetical protein